MPSDKVLVVDDEMFVRELLDEYFSKLRFSVDVAESGEAAFKLVAENHYNVALIDLKMAGLDGLETLRRIKRLDPNVVVILMTGYPTVESSIDALRAGAFDYIVKPFRLNELRDIVTSAIKEYEIRSDIAELKEKVGALENYIKQLEENRPDKNIALTAKNQKVTRDNKSVNREGEKTEKISLRGKLARENVTAG